MGTVRQKITLSWECSRKPCFIENFDTGSNFNCSIMNAHQRSTDWACFHVAGLENSGGDIMKRPGLDAVAAVFFAAALALSSAIGIGSLPELSVMSWFGSLIVHSFL